MFRSVILINEKYKENETKQRWNQCLKSKMNANQENDKFTKFMFSAPLGTASMTIARFSATIQWNQRGGIAHDSMVV